MSAPATAQPGSGALGTLQSIVARLYTDPVWLAEFEADPRAFAAARCTDEAAQVLQQIDSTRLHHFARSLRLKRAREARQLCALTAGALGDRFADVFGAHAVRIVPSGPRRPLADAMAFVRDLRNSVDVDRRTRQAAAFESCVLSMRFALRVRAIRNAHLKCEATARKRLFIRVRRFDYEFPAIPRDVVEPDGWPQRKTVVLFVAGLGRSAVWYW